MPWVRYDDGFPRHPKVAQVKMHDRSALALHLLCSTRSATTPTPGFVSEPVAVEEAGSRARAQKWARILVDADLWHMAGHSCARCPQPDSGYVIHDFEDWNPYERLSAKRAAAGRKGAASRWQRNGTSDGNSMASAIPEPSGSYGTANTPPPVDNPDPKVKNRQTESGSVSGHGKVKRISKTPDSTVTSGNSTGDDGNCHSKPSGKKWPDPDPYPSSRVTAGRHQQVADARAPNSDDDQIINKKIITALQDLTGRTVTADWAARVRHQILDGRTVRDPLAYINKTLRERPVDFLPTDRDPSSRSIVEALAAAYGHRTDTP